MHIVGDITVSRTPYNHGWTLTRDGGNLVLIGSRWEESGRRPPQDVMRFFAHLEDALTAAAADCAERGIDVA